MPQTVMNIPANPQIKRSWLNSWPYNPVKVINTPSDITNTDSIGFIGFLLEKITLTLPFTWFPGAAARSPLRYDLASAASPAGGGFREGESLPPGEAERSEAERFF